MIRMVRLLLAFAVAASAVGAAAQRVTITPLWLIGRWDLQSNCQGVQMIFRPDGTVLSRESGDGLYRLEGRVLRMKFMSGEIRPIVVALANDRLLINGLPYNRCPGPIPPLLMNGPMPIRW